MKFRSESSLWQNPRQTRPAPLAPDVRHKPGWLNEPHRLETAGLAVARGRSRHWLRCLHCGREFPGERDTIAYSHALASGHRLVEYRIEEIGRVVEEADPDTWFPVPSGWEPADFNDDGEGSADAA